MHESLKTGRSSWLIRRRGFFRRKARSATAVSFDQQNVALTRTLQQHGNHTAATAGTRIFGMCSFGNNYRVIRRQARHGAGPDDSTVPRVVFNDCIRLRQRSHAAGVEVSDTDVQSAWSPRRKRRRAGLALRGVVGGTGAEHVKTPGRQVYRKLYRKLRPWLVVAATTVSQSVSPANGFRFAPERQTVRREDRRTKVAWSQELSVVAVEVSIIQRRRRPLLRVVCGAAAKPLPAVELRSVSTPGLATFAVLSGGKTITSPKFFRRAERRAEEHNRLCPV